MRTLFMKYVSVLCVVMLTVFLVVGCTSSRVDSGYREPWDPENTNTIGVINP